ncbi:radical SAM protein [Candidatus Woesearchaeota archaeon]|nr:radical SAM protein [Candidatus Woesearchaeota archaeon]
MMRKKYLNIMLSKFKEGDFLWFPRTTINFARILLSAYTGKMLIGPINVIVAPSWKCNSLCKMCDFRSRGCEDELSTEEFKDIVDQVSRLNCSVFSFFGGEPLLRKDIFELIGYVKSKRILVQVSTNGFLLANKGNAAQLVNAGVDIVTVSLDTMDRETYKKIRGVDRLDDVVQGIKNLVELRDSKNKQLQINANLVILNENIDSIQETIKNIRELGVDVITPYPVHELKTKKNIQGADFNLKLQKLYLNMLNNKEGYYDLSTEFLNHVLGLLQGKTPKIKCFAPYTDLHIDPFGNVYPCIYFMGLEKRAANVRDKSIREIWFSREYQRVRIKLANCTCGIMCHMEPAFVFNKFWFKK